MIRVYEQPLDAKEVLKPFTNSPTHTDIGTRHYANHSPEEIPLRCAACFSSITGEQHRMKVDGSHQHVFANPHGIVFEIGCFEQAPGCRLIGLPSNEFPWFAGHYWQIAVCAKCSQHLGWRFSSAHAAFWGLVLELLV